MTPRLAKLVVASVVLAVLVPACASTRVAAKPKHERKNPRLARFMRETVNIPYAIALLAIQRPGREARVHRAAIVLRDAVQDLVHWTDPPVGSKAARDVFFAYAHNLEHHVGRLELATRMQDAELTAYSLEGIRQTCNQCHRFFRPANKISADVALDRYALDLGGRR